MNKMKSLLLVAIIVLSFSCDPPSAFPGCDYYYPITTKGLQRTIKVCDTIWIANDLDASLCLKSGIFKDGMAKESPSFYKIDNSAIPYKPTMLEYDGIYNSNYQILKDNVVSIRYKDNRYRWKYGIVFEEPGVYSMHRFYTVLRNGKDSPILLRGYFNVSSNNSDLLPEGVASPEPESGSEYGYKIYYLEVVE